MIAIINYGVGNIKSIYKALKLFYDDITVTLDKNYIEESKGIVLPGVGAFSTAMENLSKFEIDKVIKNTEKPVLGICLGLQLFAKASEEGNCDGLGLINTTVRKLPKNKYKVPHMGWNTVKVTRHSEILKGIGKKFFAYFVHSYYLKVNEYELANTDYIVNFSSAVQKDNFLGFQFHPEKSGKVGLKILKNFVEICKK